MSSPTRLDPSRPLKEPSMDEILASIRKIISDDVSPKPSKRAAVETAPVFQLREEAPKAEDAPFDSEAPPRETLLSAAPKADAAAAFAALNHVVFSKNPRTVEDLVQDMLRPMLQGWLDANLPDLVERLVRAEIERISGKS